MTKATTFKERIAVLEALARVDDEADFADFLRAYRAALRGEIRNADDCRDAAQQIREEAERLARRFEQAADYLEGL